MLQAVRMCAYLFIILVKKKRLRRPVLYRVKQEAVPTVTAEELEELLSDF